MSSAREITVAIPAIGEPFTFVRMEGEEEISVPFAFDLRISAKTLDLKASDVLGTRATIEVAGAPDSEPRHFDGQVAEFGLAEIRDDFAFYRLLLRPALWFAGLATDNRIFQNLSVPDIIDEVLRAYPDVVTDKRLDGSYAPRDYCVQFEESDLDFLGRLMEEEGIFYFFEHSADGHVTVLADANAAMRPAPGAAEIAYEPDSPTAPREGDYLTGWVPRAAVRIGAVAQTDYDFLKPSADLMAKASHPHGHAGDRRETYAYPGRHLDLGRGDRLAGIRLEEAQAGFERVLAEGTARPLGPGRRFTLTDFPREAENAAHLVLRASYRMWDEQVRAGQRTRSDGGEPVGYRASLLCAPARIPFRPERRTPRRPMRGPQTAVVVGPAGAEIHTDEHARVKVQFFWDRKGGRDAGSSCFVRVSQTWAGAGWGFIQIPRIGQEVIVDFLDGDPDRPIITGRVYNAEQIPPYGLPGSATQSGWKSNSSPGGGGWNELRFEDKAGAEEVYFQAQKDHNELIKNDETRSIGHDWIEDVVNDATQSVGHDRRESVGNDKFTSVKVNRTVSIGANDTETVGAHRSLDVGATETIHVAQSSTESIDGTHTQTVGSTQTITVKAARLDSVVATETRNVGAAQTNTIVGQRTVTVQAGQAHAITADDGWTVGGNRTLSVTGNETVAITGNQGERVGGDASLEITGTRATQVGGDEAHKVAGKMVLDVGKALAIVAADSISISCGSAAIVLKSDGTITMEGKDITVKGSGAINVKATGETTVKGSKVNLN
ncbi:type VI secretion system tip protein VgrG [uncultured Paracoccus sp.]|uniref:type VI secretion system Vgr family protein n=1 Tax=uncultured Paracoccus sp. TaxID=189685 RepID=UPI0026365961|nr:type VI secretion system tip protein VgrG [uncultured Paracoccus sp.]